MADQSFVDSLGLGMTTLFSSQGRTCAEKFDVFLQTFKGDKQSHKTKAALADGFKLWSTCTPADLRSEVLTKNYSALYEIIETLAARDDVGATDNDYKGPVYSAKILAESLCTTGQMDQTQQLSALFAPSAFRSLGRILSKAKRLDEKSPMNNKDSSYTALTELLQILLRTLPYSGTVELGDGFKTAIYPLLTQKQPPIPESLRSAATQTMSTLMMVAKSCVLPYGKELLDIARSTNNSSLLMHFVSSPELYSGSKQAVVDNLDLFIKQQYMMYCSLFLNVSNDFPLSLLPQLDFFVRQITSNQAVASVTLMIVGNIAAVKPDDVFPQLTTILAAGKIPNGDYAMAKLFGALAKASTHANAPELMLSHLVQLLESAGTGLHGAAVLVELSNVLEVLPSKDSVAPYMARIAKFRSVSEIAYTKIEDFAAGRSLAKVTAKVEELEVKINALNKKVAETCHNMADVIAYVDANMADMKDFIADVVKKLPNPKRLEVVGTLRKTLVLHFECCRTGREFPILSYEWSKWLKMGFSLVKAGQAVIDLGMGNPLGILKKGVECVQEIYSAYKTNDDDEFNTYITQPFLTSAEQDQLLEKLRDQGFFEAFAYDSQLGGWYLINPEKDGQLPQGEAGGVTKVWTKEGYGILETAKAYAKDYIGSDNIEMVQAAVDLVKPAQDDATANGSGNNNEPSSTGNSKKSTGNSGSSPLGSRAAAMREQFGTGTNQSADDKLQVANQTAADRQRMNDLESKVQALEARLDAFEKNNVAQQKGCACVIC